MLVASVRRHGLHMSATRLVHFGEPPRSYASKHEACVHGGRLLPAGDAAGRAG